MKDEKMNAIDCQSSSGSRKRTRDATAEDDSTPTVTDLSLEDQSNDATTEDFPPIKSLSLEAIFHPKFENESRNDQTIRSQMKQRVQDEEGYVEVSLKHSGSLLLWSGGERYYSKNATENPFTYVGEVLLRQHFFRAFHSDDAASEAYSMEKHYKECSQYVQENRLTLAFEAVTAILGHHGDIPKRDFLILTAVADRNAERFYSSTELVEFAQRFRLPHNDTWVFDTQQGVDALFDLYDSTRETGLAQDTVTALNGIASMHVSSMYPHVVFQGDILEGIVIRYVPYHDVAKEQAVMKGLAEESQCILQAVPPERPPSFVLLTNDTSDAADSTNPSPVLTTDVRELSREVLASGDRERVIEFLQTSVYDILCSSDDNKRRRVNQEPKQEWSTEFGAKLKQELSKQANLDTETQRILKLIESLDSLKQKVNYRIIKESTNTGDRWLCIVHVFHDTTHQKFRRKMEPNDMNLFRGFCIELGTHCKTEDSTMMVDKSVGDICMPPADINATGLMLKMKFLPYMVRTFGCRNGLDVVEKRGPRAFTEYAMKLMKRWGMSPEAQAKWQPFFSAWGKYAHLCLTNDAHEYSNSSLPKLCDAYYLDHLEHFTTLFEKGEIVGGGEESASTFRGLIFVVGMDRDKANSVAETISKKLGGLIVRKGLQSMAQEDWDSACLSREVGIVCSVVVGEDRTKGVRTKIRDLGGEALFAVMVGCDEVAVLSQCEKKDESATEEDDKKSKIKVKKLRGQITTWKETHFARIWQVSDFDSESIEESGVEDVPIQDDSAISKVLNELKEASAAVPKLDDRPGMVVFFVGIPGAGKSTLCSKDVEDKLRGLMKETDASMENIDDNGDSALPPRPVIVRVSDEVRGKYWPLVKNEKTKYPSSVYIVDKNAPPNGWTSVAQVASINGGTAVPVLPDAPAIQTTSIDGAGEYPFSLHYLAVCMARVMARPPESHSGKLDRSAGLACMILVKFFSLYRGIAPDELLPSIHRVMERGGARMAPRPVTVPFFAPGDLPELPSDLKDALIDAIRLQYEYDVILDEKVKREDEQVDEIETRLRSLLEKHRSFLFGLSVDPVVSKQSLVAQLVQQVSALPTSADDVLDIEVVGPDFVKIVSIDVSRSSVHSALQHFADKSPGVSDMLKKCSGPNAVLDTHVTMVHFLQMSQYEMREQFEHLVGCAVNVTVTGILWNERIAALAVHVASDTNDDKEVPAPKNVFPHITLWHDPELSAAYSNDLPQLVADGKAERIDFDEPQVLQGFVSLWGEDRC